MRKAPDPKILKKVIALAQKTNKRLERKEQKNSQVTEVQQVSTARSAAFAEMNGFVKRFINSDNCPQEIQDKVLTCLAQFKKADSICVKKIEESKRESAECALDRETLVVNFYNYSRNYFETNKLDVEFKELVQGVVNKSSSEKISFEKITAQFKADEKQLSELNDCRKKLQKLMEEDDVDGLASFNKERQATLLELEKRIRGQINSKERVSVVASFVHKFLAMDQKFFNDYKIYKSLPEQHRLYECEQKTLIRKLVQHDFFKENDNLYKYWRTALNSGQVINPNLADTFGKYYNRANALIPSLTAEHYQKYMPLTKEEMGFKAKVKLNTPEEDHEDFDEKEAFKKMFKDKNEQVDLLKKTYNDRIFAIYSENKDSDQKRNAVHKIKLAFGPLKVLLQLTKEIGIARAAHIRKITSLDVPVMKELYLKASEQIDEKRVPDQCNELLIQIKTAAQAIQLRHATQGKRRGVGFFDDINLFLKPKSELASSLEKIVLDFVANKANLPKEIADHLPKEIFGWSLDKFMESKPESSAPVP